MVLLHLLVQAQQLRPFGLSAVYINHGISEHAGRWGEFCQAQCQALGVSFYQQRVNLSGADNLEQRAREARYQALAAFIRSDRHLLLTAHHGDDQLETLLLALKRGAGPAGLAGIAARRPFAKGTLLRPLLAFSRQQLEQYATAHQLSWVEDDSNSDTRFERNFIRHEIAPLLRARWPHFSQTVLRSMRHLGAQQELLDHYTAQALSASVNQQGLDLTKLAAYLPAQQDLVIRQWLAGAGLNPDTQWLSTLKQQVIAARPDAMPQLVLGAYSMSRYANTLYLLKPSELQVPEGSLNFAVNADTAELTLNLPAGCGQLQFSHSAADKALALPSVAGKVVFGRLSLRFKPAGASMSKPLKQWFKLWQVPPWQRQRVPLLLVNGELVAVAGFASNIAPAEARLWLTWLPEINA
jgi:tRNA(Ile)-lysidine synthase